MAQTKLRRFQKLLLLLFTVFLLCIALLIYYHSFTILQENVPASVSLSSLDEDTVYLYGYLPTSQENPGHDAISWWYSEQDHFYYFFLPAEAKGKEVKVAFSPDTAESIVWGNQTCHSGDVVTVLTDGQIAIIMGDTTYPVNVIYGDTVSTMMIQTDSGSMEQVDTDITAREAGKITISDSASSYYYDGALTYIKGRGNSSFGYDKKSYQIKLPDKQAVCGMNSAKKWVLLPQYFDKTAIRNPISFALAQALGLQYTSDYRYVNLYVNGSYHGLYLLTEKVEVSQTRIRIRDLDKFLKNGSSGESVQADDDSTETFATFGETDYVPGTSKGYLTGVTPDDITGGYLLELELPERYASAGECGFVTTHGQAVIIKSPEYASYEEVSYISSWYQEFEDALYAEDGCHPETGLHYTDYADMDSLVGKYLVEEYVLNPDAGKTSQFFYKPNDAVSSKMYAGPVWDYDLALGALVAFSHPEGLWAAYPDDDFNIYAKLSQHDDFVERTNELYEQLLLPCLQDFLPDFVQTQQELLRTSAYMSSIRWQYCASTDLDTFTEDYDRQYNALNAFLSDRSDYLTNIWLNDERYHIVTIDTSECDHFYLGTDDQYTVQDGCCIELFYEPVKYGYTFDGFINSTTGELFDLNTPVTEDGLILAPVFSKS